LRNQDLVVLISMLGIVIGFWIFLGLANLVSAGATRDWDEWMVRAMRHPEDPALPRGPVWLPEAVRDITALGSTTVLTMVGLAAGCFLAIRRQHHALIFLLTAILGGLLLNWLLKGFFARPRPDFVPHLMLAMNPSFPSGHSLLSAVVYWTIGVLLARLVEPLKLKIYILGVAFAFSFLIGLSRIYLGVHYPSDVLAGWTVGLMWAIACWLAARELQRRGAIERAVPSEHPKE
jgi:undecaprenyl-diphosphatase